MFDIGLRYVRNIVDDRIIWCCAIYDIVNTQFDVISVLND